jgi:hypothetical protein
MQLQPIVSVAPDGFRQSALARVHHDGHERRRIGRQWGEGPYENEYVKEDGVWRISKLHWYATFIAPYEGGWLNAGREAVDASCAWRGVEPDRPPSETYEPHPGTYVPPFPTKTR